MLKLNPVHFYKSISEVIREFINYRFYRKTVNSLNDSGEFSRMNLRLDSLKRVYFVKNIQPEALLYGTSESGGIEQFERTLVAQEVMPLNELFIKSGIIELVKSRTKRIKTPDYYAYLIIINFKFRKISPANILYILAYSTAVFFLAKYIIHHEEIIATSISKLITWCKNLF